MFYTNGKILIHDFNDLELLSEAKDKIVEYLEKEEGLEVVLEISEEHGYPMYILPEDLEYKSIEEALRPNIKLKAINEDMVLLDTTQNVNVKYNYTEEEIEELSKKISSNVLESAALENEIKAIKSEYKDKIDKLQEEIYSNSQKVNQGFEFRDYPTKLKLNFSDKKRYYVDVNEPETIRKVEDMQKSDFQMQITHEFENRIEPEKLGKEEHINEDEEKF